MIVEFVLGVGIHSTGLEVVDSLPRTRHLCLSCPTSPFPSYPVPCLAADISLRLAVHQQRDNQPIQPKHLSKDKDQNHPDKQSWLLSGTTHTSITDDSDGESGSETGQANRQARTELNEAGEEGLFLGEIVGDEHADDEAVDADDTCHDDWDDV
jgi:hypothetical protein